jgi:ribonuclease III
VIGTSGDGGAAVPAVRPETTAELLDALGVPLGPELLERALTHRSFAYENGGLPTNERLEFLGDSVLGLIVTDTLFKEYPDLPEGQLAKLRAAVVNMRALAGVARGLRLGAYIRLGKGEEGTGGRDKSSILADTLEAVIGAVYLERGLDEADALVHRLFDPVIARSARLGAGLDWKTSLQELTAAEELGVPEYHVDESGPDHQKSFRASVRIGGRAYGEGEGRSKKEAEQQAAETAWTSITAGGEGRVDGARAGEGGGEVAELEGDAAGRRPAGGPQGARDVSARGAVTQDAAAGGGLEDVGADGTDLPADSAGRANGGRRPQRRS